MQQVTQRPVHDHERQRQRHHEEQADERLRHQNRSGKRSAASRKHVSKIAATRPIAFSALTGAAQPELR
jgi:hypothetical protein